MAQSIPSLGGRIKEAIAHNFSAKIAQNDHAIKTILEKYGFLSFLR